MTIDEFTSRLEGVKPNGSGYKARCPAHEDAHASLSVGRGNNGAIVLKCFAGCESADVCAALGIKLSELFPEKEQRGSLTVAEMAAHKKLPPAFLREIGLHDLRDGGIGIPYRDAEGEIVATKRRTALRAKDGSFWQKGAPLMAYGLERLADARELESLVLVEGESDCWTLWHHGIAALGVPGASSARVLERGHIEGIKIVHVIREPDKGGDSFIPGVTKRLSELEFTGRIHEVRLDGAKDPSELHTLDPLGFKAAFAKALDTRREIAEIGFSSVSDRLKGEREERIERSKRIMQFGISFLDEALGGVFPNDLVLIGAAAGEGKTALCTAIAHHNVKEHRKRIHYFALEAEEREIERRMKFREISELIYSDDGCRSVRPRLNYIDWYAGKLEGVISRSIEDRISQIVAEKFGTMFTFYKRGQFNADRLCSMLMAIQEDTDAAVVDHLHYVDVDGGDENRGVKDIVMRMRDTALLLGKPMFVVAHLRKKERRQVALVPDLDDFHGTSETPKVATKAVMIAKARDQVASSSYLWPTYMYAPKCRMDASRTRYCALVNFNARTQSYESKYVLGRLSYGLDQFETIPNAELPIWAENAIR